MQESLNLLYFFIRDAYMEGFVADHCYAPKMSVDGFGYGRQEVDQIDPDVDVLIHYMDFEYKYNIHRVMTGKHKVI